jgi:death-on-curing protein
MSEPFFLTVDDVQFLHRLSIERFGGTLGVRDMNGLEAAVYHPQNVYFYAHGDLCDIAAAYAFHIAEGFFWTETSERAQPLR